MALPRGAMDFSAVCSISFLYSLTIFYQDQNTLFFSVDHNDMFEQRYCNEAIYKTL